MKTNIISSVDKNQTLYMMRNFIAAIAFISDVVKTTLSERALYARHLNSTLAIKR